MRGAVARGRGHAASPARPPSGGLGASGLGSHFLSRGDGGVALPARTPRGQVREGWWRVSSRAGRRDGERPRRSALGALRSWRGFGEGRIRVRRRAAGGGRRVRSPSPRWRTPCRPRGRRWEEAAPLRADLGVRSLLGRVSESRFGACGAVCGPGLLGTRQRCSSRCRRRGGPCDAVRPTVRPPGRGRRFPVGSDATAVGGRR